MTQGEEYDMFAHLRSQAMKAKFLEKNKVWLLENISKLITPDGLEKHRDFIMYRYEEIVRMKQTGQLANKYDVSDDESNAEETRFRFVCFVCFFLF